MRYAPRESTTYEAAARAAVVAGYFMTGEIDGYTMRGTDHDIAEPALRHEVDSAIMSARASMAVGRDESHPGAALAVDRFVALLHMALREALSEVA